MKLINKDSKISSFVWGIIIIMRLMCQPSSWGVFSNVGGSGGYYVYQQIMSIKVVCLSYMYLPANCMITVYFTILEVRSM